MAVRPSRPHCPIFRLSNLRGPKMSDPKYRPFLINKDAEGNVRLTVRTTRYNSQGYPLVTAKLQDELFQTTAGARAFARDNFDAMPGEFAAK